MKEHRSTLIPNYKKKLYHHNSYKVIWGRPIHYCLLLHIFKITCAGGACRCPETIVFPAFQRKLSFEYTSTKVWPVLVSNPCTIWIFCTRAFLYAHQLRKANNTFFAYDKNWCLDIKECRLLKYELSPKNLKIQLVTSLPEFSFSSPPASVNSKWT